MAKAVRVRVSPTAPINSACGDSGVASSTGEEILLMNIDQYLPVLLFIFVGLGVGVASNHLGGGQWAQSQLLAYDLFDSGVNVGIGAHRARELPYGQCISGGL